MTLHQDTLQSTIYIFNNNLVRLKGVRLWTGERTSFRMFGIGIMWIATESIWNRNNWASIRKKKKNFITSFCSSSGIPKPTKLDSYLFKLELCDCDMKDCWIEQRKQKHKSITLWPRDRSEVLRQHFCFVTHNRSHVSIKIWIYWLGWQIDMI